MKINKIILFSLLFTMVQSVFAAAIFVITPTITSTYIRSDSNTLIPYTVTNNTSRTLSNITINPSFDTTANLSISGNTCNSLTSGSSCTFNLVVPGSNQPANFTVSPEICAINNTVCSQPILSAQLNVHVSTITHPVRAFVGLSNNTVYPITLVSGGAGILGTGITGFSLSEPAGIAVNLTGDIAYVTNSGTNVLFTINTNSNRISQSFNVGAVPAAVAVSPSGSTLYVVNYNNGQSNGTVSVLNAATGALLSTISVGNGPWGIAVTPDGSKLYVTNSYDNMVAVVNTATHSVITSIQVGTTPLGVAASPDGTKVYVANTQSNNVSVISTVTNQVINTIPVGNTPKGVAISPNSSQLYVANWQDGTVYVINTSTNQITALINVVGGPLGLAVSPDGTQLYVTLDQIDAVAVINTRTYAVQYVFTPTPQVTMGSFIG